MLKEHSNEARKWGGGWAGVKHSAKKLYSPGTDCVLGEEEVDERLF